MTPRRRLTASKLLKINRDAVEFSQKNGIPVYKTISKVKMFE